MYVSIFFIYLLKNVCKFATSEHEENYLVCFEIIFKFNDFIIS